MPTVSVIVPVYNVREYLHCCIDSVLAQSFTDFELILADDGSTDGSGSVCDDYAAKDSRIKVIHKENGGVSTARNAGIDRMSGSCCMFLDADDFIAADCLAQAVSSFSNNVSIVSIGRASFEEDGNDDLRHCADIAVYQGADLPGYITSRILDSSLLEKLRFNEKVSYGEDELLLLEIQQAAPETAVIDKPLYFYRIHPGSAMQMRNSNKEKRINSMIVSADSVIREYGLSAPGAAEFVERRIKTAYSDIADLRLIPRIKKLLLMKKNKLIGLKVDENTKIGAFSQYLRARKRVIRNFIKK